MLMKHSSCSFSRKYRILSLQICVCQTVWLTRKPGRLQNLATDAGIIIIIIIIEGSWLRWHNVKTARTPYKTKKTKEKGHVRAARAVKSNVSDAARAMDSSEQTVLSSAVSWMSAAMATNAVSSDGEECVYIVVVQYTWPWHHWLDAAHQWHMDKQIYLKMSKLLVNGESGCVHAWRQKDITVNICWTKTSTFHSQHTTQPQCLNCQQEVKVIWQEVPILRLVVTPGGRNLYHWIPGVGVPISVP